MAILCAQVSTAKRIVQEGGETVNGGRDVRAELSPLRQDVTLTVFFNSTLFTHPYKASDSFLWETSFS